MGNIHGITKGGFQHMEHINQTYIQKSRAMYQSSLNDYNSFMDTVNGLREQMIEYHSDNLRAPQTYDEQKTEASYNALREAAHKREAG